MSTHQLRGDLLRLYLLHLLDVIALRVTATPPPF